MHRSCYFHLNDGPLSQVNINMHSKESKGFGRIPQLSMKLEKILRRKRLEGF
jgi:hypothetical protein